MGVSGICPEGTFENSPTFSTLGGCVAKHVSPEGTVELPEDFSRPFGTHSVSVGDPSDTRLSSSVWQLAIVTGTSLGSEIYPRAQLSVKAINPVRGNLFIVRAPYNHHLNPIRGDLTCFRSS